MGFTQRAEQFLELPGGSLSGEVRVEILGTRQVTVDGACDIVTYEDTCIRLKTRAGDVRIMGDRLVMSCFHAGGMSIDGHIVSVEYV